MQKRRKIVTRSLGLVALAALVGIAVTLVPARRSEALPPAPCLGSYTTAEQWGHGASCGEASQDLFDQVWWLAEDRCGGAGVCDWGLVITGACTTGADGQEMMDGRLQHGCFPLCGNGICEPGESEECWDCCDGAIICP